MRGPRARSTTAPARRACGRLLLGFEIIEMAFGPADPPPDQTIRLAHFTADEGVTMDPSRPDDPDEKLAGVQLGHFAAFLKRSWRANDWMWGRLDAAERLVRLLDEATEHQLTRTGRLDHHLRAVQAAVLRDLLPVVAAEIEADGDAGANVTRGGPRVRRRRPRGRDPDRGRRHGRCSLADVDQDELARLLALEPVGVERLAGEVGMPRASTLLLNAATTTAALLRAEAPRGISALSGFVAWVSSRRLALAAAVGPAPPAAHRRGRLARRRSRPSLVVAGPPGGLPGWAAALAWAAHRRRTLVLAGRPARPVLASNAAPGRAAPSRGPGASPDRTRAATSRRGPRHDHHRADSRQRRSRQRTSSPRATPTCSPSATRRPPTSYRERHRGRRSTAPRSEPQAPAGRAAAASAVGRGEQQTARLPRPRPEVASGEVLVPPPPTCPRRPRHPADRTAWATPCR